MYFASPYQMGLVWYFLGTSRSLGSSLSHYVIYSKLDWRFQKLPYIRMGTAATQAVFSQPCQRGPSIALAAALLVVFGRRYLDTSDKLLPLTLRIVQ
jgi:hypothetical protein